jgi:hypothetical protein
MLFAVLFTNLCAVVQANPILAYAESSSTPPDDLASYHTKLSIIRSCLATILSCAWTTVHADIPPPGSSRFQGPAARVLIMLWIIFAPEVVIIWAALQYAQTCQLKKEHGDVCFHVMVVN